MFRNEQSSNEVPSKGDLGAGASVTVQAKEDNQVQMVHAKKR